MFCNILSHHFALVGLPCLYSPPGMSRGGQNGFTGRVACAGTPPQGWPQPGPAAPGQRHPGTASTFLQSPAAPLPPLPVRPPSVGPVWGPFSGRVPASSSPPRQLPSPPPLRWPCSELSRGSSCPDPWLLGNAAYLTRVATVTAPGAPPAAGGRPWQPLAGGPCGLARVLGNVALGYSWPGTQAAGLPRPPSPQPFGQRRRAQAALPALPRTVSAPPAAPWLWKKNDEKNLFAKSRDGEFRQWSQSR